MTEQLIVRDAVPADFDRWLPLWEGYNTFYERIGPKAVAVAITRTTWSRFFDHYEPMHCLVAEKDQRLVGLVHYIFHRNTTMLGPTCYLQDLFASVDVRGQGVGAALINGVYAKAKAAGSTRVYWQTHESNAVAQRLYDRIADRSGFIVYRRDL